MHILMVLEDTLKPDKDLINLLHNYGHLTLDQVQGHAKTYIDQEDWMAQDNAQLYHCLMSSLTKEAKAKVMISRGEYTIANLPCGAALLKIIIHESHVDTCSTVLHVWEKLSSLNTYIATISYDIGKFNAYVKDLVNSLMARGQITKDLLAFLLKAYKNLDKDFCDYIHAKQSKYEEGHNLNPNILMTQANNKYKSLLQAQTWNAPSPEL